MPKVNTSQRGRFAQKKVLDPKKVRALIHSKNGKRQVLEKKKQLKCTIVPKQTTRYESLSGTSDPDDSDTDFIYETSDDEGWV